MNMKTKIIIGAAVLVAAAFYAGTAYGSRSATSSQARMRTRDASSVAAFGNRTGANAMNARGNFITGSVLSKDDKSITVGIREGGSKIVFFGSNASITKTATGTADDIQLNSQVTVTGTANSDGSFTAQSIQLRPAGRSETASSSAR